MDADEPRRVLQRRGDVLQPQAGGVGGEHGTRLHAWFQSAEQRMLGLDVLEDGFDDHVGVRHAVALRVGNQAVEGGAGLERVAQFLGEQGMARFRAGDMRSSV